MEAVGFAGKGLVVIGDDDELAWCQHVLHATQQHAAERGFFVSKMMSKLHLYHLDDAPDLRSCNLFLKALPGNRGNATEALTDAKRLKNFYGRDNPPRFRYIKEKKRVDYGRAHDDEYFFEKLETSE